MKVDIADSQTYFQTSAWRDKLHAFQEFAIRNHGKRFAFLEMGVGWRNHLVKQPMYQLALQEPDGASPGRLWRIPLWMNSLMGIYLYEEVHDERGHV